MAAMSPVRTAGVGFAFKGARLHRGVERIGKAVHEEGGELRVPAMGEDAGPSFGEELLDGFGMKAAVGGRGTVTAGNRRRRLGLLR